MSCQRCEVLSEALSDARRALDDLQSGGLRADRLARWMRVFSCSMKQTRLLLAFVDQPERVMTRERILSLTIEDDAGDERLDRSADCRIKHLRKTVRARVPGPVIATMYGLGYGLTEGSAAALKAVAGEGPDLRRDGDGGRE